jgi:hypothetical protein
MSGLSKKVELDAVKDGTVRQIDNDPELKKQIDEISYNNQLTYQEKREQISEIIGEWQEKNQK